jgi:Cd2+/Zn2+-exporting ATPase
MITRFARVYTPAVIVLSALVMALGPLVAGGALSVWVYRGWSSWWPRVPARW